MLLTLGPGFHAAWTQVPAMTPVARIADTTRDLDLLAAAREGGDLFVALAARAGGALPAASDAETLMVASVDAAGVVRKFDVALPAEPPGAAAKTSGLRSSLRGLVSTGGQLVALLARPSGASLLTIDPRAGRLAGTFPVPLHGTEADVQVLARTSSGRMCVVGTSGVAVVVAQVGRDGAVAWKRSLPAKGVFVEDVAPTVDDGLLIVGRQGTDAAAASLWIARLSPAGELQAETRIPGYTGSAGEASVDSGLLAQLTWASKAFNLSVKSLSSRLIERSSATLLEGIVLPVRFQLAPLSGGGAIVGGIKDGGLWLARVGRGGEPVWRDWRDPKASQTLEVASNVRLLPGSSDVIAAYTAFGMTADRRREPRSVRIVRIPN